MAAKPNGSVTGGNSGAESSDDYPIISGSGESDSDGSGIPTVDAGEADGTGAPSPQRRGRGRPKGTRNTSAPKQKQTAQDLSGILLSTHFMLAAFLNVKELALDPEESKRLGDAVNKVQAEYDLTVLDPKTLAWINLLITAGGIYGPRYAAYSLRQKKEKQGKPPTIDAQPVKVM